MPTAKNSNDDGKPPTIERPGIVRQSMIAEQVDIPGRGFTFAIHERMADDSWQTREDSTILDSSDDTSRMIQPLRQPLWPLAGRPVNYGSDLELFNDIREFYRYNLDVRNKRCYDVIGSYVFMSYRTEEFDVVPYLDFLGPKGRGKSRGLELLSHVCYRGWLITHPSPASVFWVVDRFYPTLLADNYEFWPKDTRSELDGLFNAGYRRGAVVPRRPREGEGGSEIVIYKVFGPKALAGTRAPVDSLGSRCILVQMSKSRREIPLKIDQSWAQNLRDKLLTYRFRHFQQWRSST